MGIISHIPPSPNNERNGMETIKNVIHFLVVDGLCYDNMYLWHAIYFIFYSNIVFINFLNALNVFIRKDH